MSNNFKVVSLLFAVIAIIYAVISIELTKVSIKLIKVNTDALNQQNETAIKSERNERFKNAIEQLGNDKNAIVLGGIYTLHRIAKEDESYIENVFNILCAYVRDITKTKKYQKKYKEKPSEPIQTILNILCRKEEDRKVYRTSKDKLIIDFSSTYLRNANLHDSNLRLANLYNVNLKSAYSSIDVYVESFEERIKSRIGEPADLSGIKGGYDPNNSPFKGEPIIGAYTAKEADEIIKEYYVLTHQKL